jgi:hypothetical protein
VIVTHTIVIHVNETDFAHTTVHLARAHHVVRVVFGSRRWGAASACRGAGETSWKATDVRVVGRYHQQLENGKGRWWYTVRRDRLYRTRGADDFSEILPRRVVYVGIDPPRVSNPAYRHS